MWLFACAGRRFLICGLGLVALVGVEVEVELTWDCGRGTADSSMMVIVIVTVGGVHISTSVLGLCLGLVLGSSSCTLIEH